jgi:hypothetical protein
MTAPRLPAGVERDVVEYHACVDYSPGPPTALRHDDDRLVQYMDRELRSRAERGIPRMSRPPSTL